MAKDMLRYCGGAPLRVFVGAYALPLAWIVVAVLWIPRIYSRFTSAKNFGLACLYHTSRMQ